MVALEVHEFLLTCFVTAATANASSPKPCQDLRPTTRSERKGLSHLSHQATPPRPTPILHSMVVPSNVSLCENFLGKFHCVHFHHGSCEPWIQWKFPGGVSGSVAFALAPLLRLGHLEHLLYFENFVLKTLEMSWDFVELQQFPWSHIFHLYFQLSFHPCLHLSVYSMKLVFETWEFAMHFDSPMIPISYAGVDWNDQNSVLVRQMAWQYTSSHVSPRLPMSWLRHAVEKYSAQLVKTTDHLPYNRFIL